MKRLHCRTKSNKRFVSPLPQGADRADFIVPYRLLSLPPLLCVPPCILAVDAGPSEPDIWIYPFIWGVPIVYELGNTGNGFYSGHKGDFGTKSVRTVIMPL